VLSIYNVTSVRSVLFSTRRFFFCRFLPMPVVMNAGPISIIPLHALHRQNLKVDSWRWKQCTHHANVDLMVTSVLLLRPRINSFFLLMFQVIAYNHNFSAAIVKGNDMFKRAVTKQRCRLIYFKLRLARSSTREKSLAQRVQQHCKLPQNIIVRA